MPRPKKPGSGEPKTRSRHGCWPCKTRKIKCGEEKPSCVNCERNGEKCDYSIKLNWQGRNKKGGSPGDNMLGTSSFSPVQYDAPKIKSERLQASPPAARISFYGATQSPPGLSPGASGHERHGSDGGGQAVKNHEAINGNTLEPMDLTSTPTAGAPPPLHVPFQRLRELSEGSYPSPANSTGDSSEKLQLPTLKHLVPNHSHPTSHPDMPPPYANPPSHQALSPTHPTAGDSPMDSAFPIEQRSKKMRFSPSGEVSDPYLSPHSLQPNGLSSSSAPSFHTAYRPPSMPQPPTFSTAHSSPARLPITPSASAGSDEPSRPFPRPSSHSSTDIPTDRRVSVQSLLSEMPSTESPGDGPFPGRLSITSNTSSEKMPYGIDRGIPDRDIPNNDDHNALSDRTPTLSTIGPADLESDAGVDDAYSEFGFALDANNDMQDLAPYYSKPVRVCISRSLEPLPPELRDNQMNLLYFHHFLDHTARILVPHDCSENPFKSILPKMALGDPTLLHLLLAYSACHRSRLLNHPEPLTRISLWMRGVFPALANALRPDNQVSDSNLAAAIMLASLEIIAPKSFEVEVPWQQHLNIARQMIVRRGHGRPTNRRETVAYFLTRWFAYLDVLGSLSGRENHQPLFHGNYWTIDTIEDEQSGYQIDCLLGFTSRCVGILAKIAELARKCDAERIDPDGNNRADWRPSKETLEQAQLLKVQLEEARMHRYHGCPHRRSSTQNRDNESYAVELVTTNDAFHWAGLIHLHRRVLGKASEDPEVQLYVREIVTALYKIRKGGTAESCLLFPMFTAGCDAREQSQRSAIMDRLKSVEGSGMFQVRQARALMEKVWETGRSWETFSGVFIG